MQDTSTKEAFEPRIIGFCCKFCAYAAADLAGSMRISYPASVKIIQVPCTGRIDMIHILKSLEDGADGVMIAGCLEGECHFLQGNFKARSRVEAVRRILAQIGMEPDRVAMFNLSSAMGPKFAEITAQMTDRIRQLGPSPVATAGKKSRDAA
ncbi:hydrogenase iron-sulfur subunit [Desulfotignum phosphitoxidans]|jgi:coenzyme F420-reducing hydrogenase delta subunit|uniref:Methyl-viologen-reducing hydrogenase subunit delta MvhD n=1 Tax=Desulfotignum phosphitoxidans DSM 13687 TaxID=1286635 RepID=S0G3D4_9BACT|nr:hydrogenase iron-sulfur subunit [Desulfotignum phosphitoxidans]EMS81420.1 methyl-viologen-reducing hydrogenase subunit delta MvhD [Desulfotignum phosphitoxidans DSM 13687]